MRRFLGIATVAFSVGAGSSGYAGDFWSDYQAAIDTFRVGEQRTDSEYEMKAATRVMAGIEGKWLELSWTAKGDDADMKRVCDYSYFEAVKTTDFSFSLTKKFKGKPEEDMPYQYNFVDNDSYVRSVDPAIFLKVQKADKPETDASMKLHLFGQYGDTPVEVFRPNDRLLVVKPQRAAAEIYGKCP